VNQLHLEIGAYKTALAFKITEQNSALSPAALAFQKTDLIPFHVSRGHLGGADASVTSV
jgi:hypothetical protein